MNCAPPTGLLSLSVGPKTPDDAQRLASALEELCAEDPTLGVATDAATGETSITGVHEPHLESVVDRLKRDFSVDAVRGRPKVLYREALTRPAEADVKHRSVTEGRGEYAHVKLRLCPNALGSGSVFTNSLVGAAIPPHFIAAVEEGIRAALARGVVAGYPIHGVRVEIYDGSYHAVDSTVAAFCKAGFLAAALAARRAEPVLLEPVMLLEAVVPHECAGGVKADIASRRGEVVSQQDSGDTHVIGARVPLAELLGYPSALRSRTAGRGSCTMCFEEYRPCSRPEDGDDSRGSLVGAPRRPVPNSKSGGEALPEPDDDAF